MTLNPNQIISKSNTFLSEDFVDLSTEDTIDIFFPSTDKAIVFVRNADSTISFGDYTKGVLGYVGTLSVVSLKAYFPNSSEIFISENTYNPEEYFLFYNVDNKVMFRTFNSKQGYFADEKILTEDYTIKQLKRVYENIIFIIEVNDTEEIFKFIDDLPNKQLKLSFLFTSEVEKWNRDNISPTLQIIETPFSGINETAFTLDNLTGDEGFVYIKGDNVTEEYDEKAINGNVLKKFEEIYVRMGGISNYTLNMRAKLSEVDTNSTIMLTNNYEVKFDGSTITLLTDTIRQTEVVATDASEPCVRDEVELDDQLPSQSISINVSIRDYTSIYITNTFFNNINTISLFVDGNKITLDRDLGTVTENYTPDTFLRLQNLFTIDYLSQQRYALNDSQIYNLINVFEYGANAEAITVKKSFSFKEIERLLYVDNNEIIVDNPLNGSIQNVTVTSTLDNETRISLGDDLYEYSEVANINGTGILKLVQFSTIPTRGKLTIEYQVSPFVHSIEYTENHKLNSSYKYTFGKYLPINKDIDISLLKGTVVPYKLSTESGIPRVIFSDPKKQIRVGNSTNQVYDRVPFVIEDRYESGDYVIWISLDNFGNNGIPVQYGLRELDVMDTHTFSKYETLSSGTYSKDDYYFAYHFTNLRKNNNVRIKNLFIEESGELFLVGNTNTNDYVREVREIRFMDIPKKYKTNFFKVKIDTDNKDKQSFINNNVDVKRLARKVIDEWKPSHTNLTDIEESNAVIMSNLLSDEFAQVLVGFTPNSNVNSYYVRSIESGELDVYTSSGRFDESIDWLAIGRLDSPYVKAGVTKVNTSAKQFKIFFESRFDNSDYRVFVWNPNNSKYYVPSKDQDGFIVESSYLVEDEVSWLAINSNQVVNGTIVWREGIPEDEKRVSNLDRVTEIGVNSHKYTLNFNDIGFDSFDSTEYSVILASDSNVNLWYSDKKLNSVDIRRSYTGDDMRVDYLIVRGDTKWYNNITG